MSQMGKPLYWNLDEHIKAIEGMIRSDEIQIALNMCDRIPAWYRDNYPKELTDIKNMIYKKTYDQIEYATDDEEAGCTREFGEAQWNNGYMFPRAEIISKIIKDELTNNPIPPWIFDLGSSHGNLPLGLLKAGYKFHYRGAGMNYRILEKLKGWVGGAWHDKPAPGQATILYCSEVLEHCFNEMDIVHSAKKIGVDFDKILLSVPKYTLGGGLYNWDSRRLGHVKTYSPSEFLRFADTNFPGYKWEYYDAPSMVIVGNK